MKWYSKLAIVTLVVLAMAVIQDAFTAREAEAVTTLTKNTGQYFFTASDTITAAGGVKVIRWPHKTNAKVQTFVSTGDSSTSSTFTYFIADKGCTLDVFTRSAPAGSLQVVLSSDLTSQTPAALDIEGLPVDSLRITVTSATTRFWVTAYR